MTTYKQIKWSQLRKTIYNNKYIIKKPTQKQIELLLRDEIEVLFGGAAGGGKTCGSLQAALQYVNEPNYSAIIMRRQLTDARIEGGIGALLDEWLTNTDAKKDGNTWHFPSGATVQMGYLKAIRDMYRYDSSRFDTVIFEELTHFLEAQYTYMYSRLRRDIGSFIPPRCWSTTNPGGPGHYWVKAKFIDQNHDPSCVFIPALLKDNPFIDELAYRRSLAKLDPITRAQKEDGNWIVSLADSMFRREKVQILPEFPAGLNFITYWDKAATEPKKGNTDPDFTCGVKMAEKNGIFYIADVRRFRKTPPDVEARIKLAAETDGYKTPIFMEQEPGSSGVDVIDHYTREVLKGYIFRGIKTTGSKTERAAPMSSAWDAGNFRLLRAPWNTPFLDELELFPLGGHDDQVDAADGAFEQLTKRRPKPKVACVGVTC